MLFTCIWCSCCFDDRIYWYVSFFTVILLVKIEFKRLHVIFCFVTVFFVMGKSSYTYVKMSSENMLVQVSKCVSVNKNSFQIDKAHVLTNVLLFQNAFTTKMREKNVNPRKNFLDYSIDKYGSELVGDVRRLSRILVLYLPLPLFWTLYDQKGSRWTIQVSFIILSTKS